MQATANSHETRLSSSIGKAFQSVPALKVRRPRAPAKQQPIEAATLPDALLKMQTVIAVTGLSSATIYRKVATKEFPAPVKLGQRCTRWAAGSVREWLAAQHGAPIAATAG